MQNSPAKIEVLFQEGFRKLLHFAVFVFIIPLRWFGWRYAFGFGIISFFWNLWIMPRWFRASFRAEELARSRSLGMLFYSLCVALLSLAFPLPILASSWAVLSISDALSSIVGRFFGKTKLWWNKKKSWAGFFAYFISASICGWIFFIWTRLNIASSSPFWLGAEVLAKMMVTNSAKIFLFSTISAFFSSLAESLCRSFEDNLIAPFVYGLVLCLLFIYL